MAFDFYFAGSSAPETDELIVKLNANVLRSYVNDKKTIQKFIEYRKNGWTGKFMVDNGAFTVHRKGGVINIDDYIKWINDNDQYVDYFIALDDIPGVWGEPRTVEQLANAPIKTWDNYLYMYDRVNNPKKLLPVFHQGENFKWLENILRSGKAEYICISGNKELTNKQREVWYDKCFNYINKLAPNIKVHCLGSATMSNAEKFPFTSMDSTTCIMVGANGNILYNRNVVYVGDGCKGLSHDEYEVLKKYISDLGFSIDTIGDRSVDRILCNMKVVFDQSKTIRWKGLKVKRKGLF